MPCYVNDILCVDLHFRQLPYKPPSRYYDKPKAYRKSLFSRRQAAIKPKDVTIYNIYCERKKRNRFCRAAFAVMRCLCMCVSVTFVHSVKTSTHILRLFSLSGRSFILVFPNETGRQYSDGNPPNKGIECKGGIKNHDFRLISRFISELMQDRAIVTMEGE